MFEITTKFTSWTRRAILLGLLTVPALSLATPDGEALYDRHCNACHQTEGHGGIGLSLSAWKFTTISDDYLHQTIRHGRPGRIMPKFDVLSDAQVDAIVAFLRKRSGTPSPAYDPAPLPGDAADGQPLYNKLCARCHGENGHSKGIGTGVTLSRERKFPVIPPAISNPGFLDSAPDEMIKAIVQRGRQQSGMPNFGEVLSDTEIANIIAYVRSLRRDQPEDADMRNEPSAIIVESPEDFDTTVTRLREAIRGSNFRIFPARFLEQGLTDEFSTNKRQVGVRFCNFSQLYNMLNVEPRLGIVLPCRITVVEKADGQVVLIAPNMRKISTWFNNEQLSNLAKSMAQTIEDVLDETSL